MNGFSSQFRIEDYGDYFTPRNVDFLKRKIHESLSKEFRHVPQIKDDDLLRTMRRIAVERREALPFMNERVIMYITNSFKNNQQLIKNQKEWERQAFTTHYNQDITHSHQLANVHPSHHIKQSYKLRPLARAVIFGSSD